MGQKVRIETIEDEEGWYTWQVIKDDVVIAELKEEEGYLRCDAEIYLEN